MSQLLKLVKKGDRYAPTVYQFGANEHLNVHRSDQYADLTDANTGSYIRAIGWQGLRDMGYSPAKLLDGDETDQFLPSVGFSRHLIDCAKYILIGGAVVLTLAVTGANAIDTGIAAQDALTYEHKVYLEENTNPDAEDDMSWEEYEASQQAKTAAHANSVIAKAYGRKS